MRLFRRRRLPADQRPALDADERVVAWAPTVDDSVVVVSNRGLWLPRHDRLGWHEIHKATWSGRQLTVVPGEVVGQSGGYSVVADGPAVVVTLVDPDDVPEQVRTRVTRSVAYSSHHPLPGGGGVRVVGRRVPGADGLSWHVRYDEGASVEDPAVQTITGELVAQAMAGTGANNR
ncbi:MAG TPA: hypothetical protein VF054_20455 [Micromonosporaceae bacterium]